MKSLGYLVANEMEISNKVIHAIISWLWHFAFIATFVSPTILFSSSNISAFHCFLQFSPSCSHTYTEISQMIYGQALLSFISTNQILHCHALLFGNLKSIISSLILTLTYFDVQIHIHP